MRHRLSGPAEIHPFDGDLLMDGGAAAAGMIQQQAVEAVPLHMQSRAREAEIGKRDLVNPSVPDGYATGLGDKTLCLDEVRRPEAVGVFPEMRNQAFPDRRTRVAGLFQDDGIDAGAGQQRRRAGPRRPAADDEYAGVSGDFGHGHACTSFWLL